MSSILQCVPVITVVALYLLPAWELELCPPESFDGRGSVRVLSPDGQDHLTDVDASHRTLGLTECTTHSCLKPVRGEHVCVHVSECVHAST